MHTSQYAGFWIRFLATLIDAVIIGVLIAIPLTYIYGSQYWFAEDPVLVRGTWDLILNYVVPIVLTIFFWLQFRATPGKMLTCIQVVDADTLQTMSLKQSVIRYFSYIISTLPLGLGFIWVAFDQRKQGWHDKIANSLVIKESVHLPPA